MISVNFVIVGAAFNLVGSSAYALSTLRGRTRPNRVTWFVWSLAAFIAFSAQLSQHVGLRALMTFMVGFGPLMIFVASFVNKKSYWRVTRFDLICGALSLFALVLWQITGIGNVAIALSIVADFLAMIPTLKKSYDQPSSEHSWPFLTGIVSSGLTLLTLKTWSFADGGFALYILMCSVVIFSLVHFKIGTRVRMRAIPR